MAVKYSSDLDKELDQVKVNPLLTIPAVAKILGVSRPTVYELIYHEGLPFVKLRKNIRVVPLSLQQWIAGREQY